MITALYSLGQVHGAELWLLFWLLCAIAYAGGCRSTGHITTGAFRMTTPR